MKISLAQSLCILIATSVLVQPVIADDNTVSAERQIQLLHLLKQDCGSCHGMTLKGGLGPALLPENLENKPTLFLKNTILSGRPGTAMPPWAGILTDKESLWLVQQLQQGIQNEQ